MNHRMIGKIFLVRGAIGVVLFSCFVLVVASAVVSLDQRAEAAASQTRGAVPQFQWEATSAPQAPADTAMARERINVSGPGLTDASKPDATPVATATPAEMGTSRRNPLPLGVEVRDENWSIVLSEVTRGAEAAQVIAEPQREGYQYLIANVTVKNISHEPEAHYVDLVVDDVSVTGDKNILYSHSSYAESPNPLGGTLPPGGATKGQIVFEIPSDEKNLMFFVGKSPALGYTPDTGMVRFIAIDEGAKIAPDSALENIKRTDVGNRRANAAKIGETLVIKAWEFKIVEAVRGDEAAELLKKVAVNKPAPKGQEYVAVQVRARYLGSGKPDHAEYIGGSFLKVTGEKNVVYKEVPPVVVPGPDLVATLFAGGETEGWVVLSVSKGEKGLLVIFEPPGSSNTTRYIAIP
jgi:hypothetical protein